MFPRTSYLLLLHKGKQDEPSLQWSTFCSLTEVHVVVASRQKMLHCLFVHISSTTYKKLNHSEYLPPAFDLNTLSYSSLCSCITLGSVEDIVI